MLQSRRIGGAMNAIRKLICLISQLEKMVSGTLLAVIVALNFIEICRRELFAKSFPWIQELSIVLVCWMIYLGAAYIYNTSNLLNVDFLLNRTSGIAKFVWELILHLVSAFLLVVLIVWGIRYAIVQNSAKTYALHFSYSLYSIPLVICATSMLLKLIEKIYDTRLDYQNYRRRKEEPV